MNEHNDSEKELFGTNSIDLFIHTARLGSVWSNHISSNRTDLIWLAIVTHNLLQNAMVNVLQGSAKIGALTDKSRREQLQWLNAQRGKRNPNTSPPPSRLADFRTLLDRLQDSNCLDPIIQLGKTQYDNLIDLNSIRNNFVHYKGSHWLLHVDDFKLPILAALKLIHDILQHHESLIWKVDSGFKRIEGYLTSIRSNIESL